jgi:carbonic anhydrase/acetyltransferase-like protein (isoleucine patch superfamily)
MPHLRCASMPIWVAPTAVIAGDVSIGEGSSVWHHAVLRGDMDAIRIGAQSNVQDNAVVHTDEGMPATIGDRVVVGHGAIVHACTIGDEVTVGMGAIVMSGAQVGAGSYIGGGAVLTEGMVVPPRSIVVGVPAKVLKPATEEHVARTRRGALGYVEAARQQLPAWPPMVGDPALRLRR